MPEESLEVIKNPLPCLGDELVSSSPITLDEDKVLLSIMDEEPADSVLKAVLWGLAEEQQSLRTLRAQKMNSGKDTSNISLKRGTLLKFMSETLLQRQALSSEFCASEIDFNGPRFKAVFKMFLEVISDTFDEIKIPMEYKGLFFQALSRNLEGWEEKAEKMVKNIGATKL